MKILLLSFYYPPDIGPGPVRAKSLTDALHEIDKSVFVDVMTTVPNRYHSLRFNTPTLEKSRNTSVKRILLPCHRSGMRDQAGAFLVFARNILKETKGYECDVVVATSSRLMTAVLGAYVAKRSNAKFYLDIRDLFRDTMKDVLSKSPLRVILPLIGLLEKWVLKSADGVNIVSGGFLPYLKKVFPEIEPTIYTNGVDIDFVRSDFSLESSNTVPVILYAGNIGQGQGLESILLDVAQTLRTEVKFLLLGDGGERRNLGSKVHGLGLKSISILDPVSRDELFVKYKNADILFLHLNDFDAFKKVLPSKIFEYAATGKPILAGVDGYAAEFIKANISGAIVFDPGNADDMISGIKELLNGPREFDRSEFCAKFLRPGIMKKMAADILSV